MTSAEQSSAGSMYIPPSHFLSMPSPLTFASPPFAGGEQRWIDIREGTGTIHALL